MWLYVLQGIGYGFAAAAQPGPFQTYLITQTLINTLRPGPYSFWGLVAIILVFGAARRLGPRVNHALQGASAIAICCSGLVQLWLGVRG